MATMVPIVVYLPEPLARRVRLVAADRGVSQTQVCRGLLDVWLKMATPRPALEEAPRGTVEVKIMVPPAFKRLLRIAAAELDQTPAETALRVITATCPHAVELLAAAIERAE